MKVKEILFESDKAAKFVKGIKGWIDSRGIFFGDDEHAARYSGCTHIACKTCGASTPKTWIFCQQCRTKLSIEKYSKRERKTWDGETPLYSDHADTYFFNEDDLIDFIDDNECTVESLHLIICDPVYLCTLDEDYWCDVLGEDGKLPNTVLSALDNLNQTITKAKPVSWEPGEFAAIYNL